MYVQVEEDKQIGSSHFGQLRVQFVRIVHLYLYTNDYLYFLKSQRNC